MSAPNAFPSITATRQERSFHGRFDAPVRFRLLARDDGPRRKLPRRVELQEFQYRVVVSPRSLRVPTWEQMWLLGRYVRRDGQLSTSCYDMTAHGGTIGRYPDLRPVVDAALARGRFVLDIDDAFVAVHGLQMPTWAVVTDGGAS